MTSSSLKFARALFVISFFFSVLGVLASVVYIFSHLFAGFLYLLAGILTLVSSVISLLLSIAFHTVMDKTIWLTDNQDDLVAVIQVVKNNFAAEFVAEPQQSKSPIENQCENCKRFDIRTQTCNYFPKRPTEIKNGSKICAYRIEIFPEEEGKPEQ